MNWFHLANVDSIFEQAGETDVLKRLRKIKDMSTQTQRGTAIMLDGLRERYIGDESICSLLKKAKFYCRDSPKKVKVLVSEVIERIASNIVKKRKADESNSDDKKTVTKGLTDE